MADPLEWCETLETVAQRFLWRGWFIEGAVLTDVADSLRTRAVTS